MKKKLLKIIKSLLSTKDKFDKIKQNSSFKVLLFTLVIVFFTYLFISQSLTVVQLGYEMGEMQEKMNQLETDKKLLAEQVEHKTTDAYIEESARDKLNMVKSNEKPIEVIEKENKELIEETKIEPKDKMSIYMTDWYVYIDELVEGIKKN